MLNQLIRKTSQLDGNSTATYVLCQGNKFERREKWWGEMVNYKDDNEKASAKVEFLMASPDFKRIFSIMATGSFGKDKSLKRLIVWLKTPYHVFSLVWEVYFQNDLKSVCYTIDNLGRTVLNRAVLSVFLVEIKKKINVHRRTIADLESGHITLLDTSIPQIVQSDLHMSKDLSLMCVSFMARSTL